MKHLKMDKYRELLLRHSIAVDGLIYPVQEANRRFALVSKRFQVFDNHFKRLERMGFILSKRTKSFDYDALVRAFSKVKE